jgi:molecular chaperone GrpE (heat shock protein)
MNYNDDGQSDKVETVGAETDDLLEINVTIDEEPENIQSPEVIPEKTFENEPNHASDEICQEMILKELRDMGKQIGHLASHFEGKIKYDEHKNKIIDDLHEQLQDFRDGIIKKHLLSMITDVIKIIDDIRKFKSHHKNSTPPENAAGLFLDFMDQITSDLEDLFTFQGIYSFSCKGNTFDSARQRVIKRIETDDPGKDKHLAERIRPGYEWEGKVIRPEMVSIYAYNEQPNNKAGES